jgi:hypothetical protein
MRSKEIVRLGKIRSALIFHISFFFLLMFLSAGSIARAQTTVALQNAEPSQSSGSDASTKVSNGAAVISAQPRMRSPIHIVPFREPGAMSTKLNLFPVGSHVDYFGGPVISNVHIVLVLYGPGAYLANIAGTTPPTMANFYNDITKSTFFDMLSEYSTIGVRAFDGTAGTNQFIGHGFFDGQFTITPNPANNGATITDNQIQAELLAQVGAGNLPVPVIDAQGNSNTLYMIFFPPGKTINDGTVNSCVTGGFCAYHNSTTSTFSTHRLFYGVMPDLQPPSGCSRGCGSGTTFDQATNVTSHELSESVTDADVGPATSFARPLAWIDQTNGEIGDICVAQESSVVANGTTYTVQQEFSNLQNDCVSAPPVLQLTPSANIALGSSFGLNLSVRSSTSSSNVLSGYTGTVHFTSSDPGAILPADYTFKAADAGSHDFIATVNTAGSQTITVRDTTITGFTGSTTVSAATNVARALRISIQGNAATGAPATLVVDAVDALNGLVPSYSGTVRFTSTDAGAVLPPNTVLTNGTGTFTATFNTVGPQSLTVTDVGNPTLTGTNQVRVAAPAANPTTTTLTSAQQTTTFGQPASVTMTVTGTGVTASPANYDITVDGQQFSFGAMQGSTVQTMLNHGGRHTVFADYLGDATRGASSSAPLVMQVNPASVPVTLAVSSNSTVSGTPLTLVAGFNGNNTNSGSFTFFDGTTPLGVTSASTFSLLVNGLFVGTHSITAVYSGSADILAATSTPVIVTVTPPAAPDFSTSSSQSGITLAAGQSITFVISAQSLNGFFGTVKFSCGSLPVLVTCSFSPATATVTPGSPFATALLTVKTTGPHAALINPHTSQPVNTWLWASSPFALGLVMLAGLKGKRSRMGIVIGMLALVMVVGVSSCGGGGGTQQTIVTPATTPAGTTTFVLDSSGTAITGSAPANPTQHLNIGLTVQP